MSESAFVIALLLGLLLLMFVLVGIGIALNAWWISRQENLRAEREAALKRHMLDRGLSVDDIERVIRATAEQPKQPANSVDEDVDALGEFAGLLGACQAHPDAIEEVFPIFRAADSVTQKAILRAITEMRDSSEEETITKDQIRAVVRALARPAEKPAELPAPANDLSPLTGTASRISDAFHLPD
jgi:hypothetical protein